MLRAGYGRRLEGYPKALLGLDQSYAAVLNYASSLGYRIPSPSQRVKQNQLIFGLKSSGAWDKCDILYVFATDGDSDFATLNWKNPAAFQCTKVNGPTFTANRGFKGDGISSYLSTNFNPATNGVNYTLNSAGRFSWVSTAASGPGAIAVLDGCTNTFRNRLVNQNTNLHRINQDTNNVLANINLSGTGLKSLNRTTSNDVVGFSDTTRTDTTAASTSIQSDIQSVLRVSSNYGDAEIGVYGLGANLVSENTALYNAINAYMTGL